MIREQIAKEIALGRSGNRPDRETAAIIEERFAMEWQPIETAPKDGSAILLFGGEGCFGWSPPNGMGPISICFWSKGRWLEATGEQYETHQGATHWMPLPSPPHD